MRKIASLVVYGYIVASLSVDAASRHLDWLKSRYPYGLIGDDYGILTPEDLAVNTCNTLQVEPFSPGKNFSYPYWQCFRSLDAKMKCEHSDIDPSTKEDIGYLSIEARNERGIQFYLARDARSMNGCKQYLLSWKQKIRGERHVCISGSYGRIDESHGGRKQTDWILEKFKTRKGCDSRGTECRLKDLSSLDNCLLPR